MLRRIGLVLVLAGATLSAHALHIPAKALVAQWLLQRAWVQARAEDARVRPWPWADTWPVARLEVAEARFIVLTGAEGGALPFAPAWLPGSAAPGEPGTAVIAGHRDTHFNALAHVAVGDALAVGLPDGRMLSFRVTRLEVRDAATDSLLLRDDGVPRLALVTCYPLDAIAPGGPLRYVVWAELAA
jgi:sortase A